MSNTNLEITKGIIGANYYDGEYGLFFTRNIAGDEMSTLYEDEHIQVDICYDYEYFEVFGLTETEEEELEKYYESLQRRN